MKKSKNDLLNVQGKSRIKGMTLLTHPSRVGLMAAVFIWVTLSVAPEAWSSRRAKPKYKPKYPTSWCATSQQPVVASSIYFVPHRKDYRDYKSFKKAVRMQGTGTLGNGKVLRYNGKIQKLPQGCSTAVGWSGKCLIPFFSIAADPKYHRKGDVIFIPKMKGLKIKLDDGQEFEHPGYFVVDDTGSAIKGINRFDFFTGSVKPKDSDNAFGYKSSTKLSAVTSCDKAYSVIRDPVKKNAILADLNQARSNHQKQLAMIGKGSDKYAAAEQRRGGQ